MRSIFNELSLLFEIPSKAAGCPRSLQTLPHYYEQLRPSIMHGYSHTADFGGPTTIFQWAFTQLTTYPMLLICVPATLSIVHCVPFFVLGVGIYQVVPSSHFQLETLATLVEESVGVCNPQPFLILKRGIIKLLNKRFLVFWVRLNRSPFDKLRVNG